VPVVKQSHLTRQEGKLQAVVVAILVSEKQAYIIIFSFFFSPSFFSSSSFALQGDR
jgi:hypothetical protein